MNKLPSLSLAITLIPLLSFTAFGQFSSGNQAGLNAAMMKLFGNTTAFSAKADVSIRDKAEKESVSMTMNFALLDRKVRLEMDMSQVKSAEMTPQAAAMLKQMGMDRMISLVQPDKKNTLVIYPTLQAYAEVPMTKEEGADLDKTYKMQTTKLGAETIDGHPCQKNKVVVTGDKGEKHEAIVWNATDLRDFPVRIQMKQEDATMVMQYKDIKLTRPDPKQFEPPAGYTKHDSIERLMQGALLKQLGGTKP